MLTKNDVVEVKSLKNPPAGVRLVMEVACIFFARAPKMVPDTREGAKPGAKMQDYWGQSTDLVKGTGLSRTQIPPPCLLPRS